MGLLVSVWVAGVCVKELRVCGFVGVGMGGWCVCKGVEGVWGGWCVYVKELRVCGYGWLVCLCEGVEGVWVWVAGVFV